MPARKSPAAGRLIAFVSAAALMAVAAPAASAHKPYLLPYIFGPERDYVGVEGAMVEDNYFVPDFAIRGSGDWLVTGPDGVTAPLKPTNLKSISVADAPLPAEGTYRISTGERAGRAGKAAKIDGVWRTVRPAPPAGSPPPPPPAAPRPGEPGRGPGPIDAADVPADAETIETQGFLIAETYVSRGVPTPAALKPKGKGFELEPITHPNEIFLDDGFSFRLLVDGRPAAGATAFFYRGDEVYEAGRTLLEVKTDAEGKATVTFPKPGIYMLNTRYPDAPAPGDAPAARSWTYTLTFEVTQ